MKTSHVLLGFSVGLLALASPARSAITVSFGESAIDGLGNPIPIVTGSEFVAQGGDFSTVVLPNFFATPPATAFSFTYSLLEPAGLDSEPNDGISDQVTFASFPGEGGVLTTSLLIIFTSDPFNFSTTTYGSATESGQAQTIPLPPNMPGGHDTLTVTAQSDLDPPLDGGVPEPGTWTMMLLGFGAIGAAMRYRARRRTMQQAAGFSF